MLTADLCWKALLLVHSVPTSAPGCFCWLRQSAEPDVRNRLAYLSSKVLNKTPVIEGAHNILMQPQKWMKSSSTIPPLLWFRTDRWIKLRVCSNSTLMLLFWKVCIYLAMTKFWSWLISNICLWNKSRAGDSIRFSQDEISLRDRHAGASGQYL